VVSIDVYNTAGERVRAITKEMVSAKFSEKKVLLLNESGSEVTVFNPETDKVSVALVGIESINQGSPVSLYEWDGKNDNGANLSSGSYYIKVSVADDYGGVETKVLDVNLLRMREYVRINIFNSAGELVKRIEKERVTEETISLDLDDTFIIGKNGTVANINYAPGETEYWDGTNADGIYVTSGVYQVQVEVKSAEGYSVFAAKEITVINEGEKDVLGNISVYPNPFVTSKAKQMKVTFAWTEMAEGTVTIRVYNMAGEVIKGLRARINDGKVDWNLKTSGGADVAPGYYPCLVEAVKDTGARERKIVKVAVIKNN